MKFPATGATRTLEPGKFVPRGTIDILLQLSLNGTEIITPLPVPIHNLFDEINNAVIRTNENPSFPVPTKAQNVSQNEFRVGIFIRT